jgi:hypothetical protein
LQGTLKGGVRCQARVVAEEADETVFWLEMLVDCEIMPLQKLEPLLQEAKELTAIFSASQHTAKVSR